MLNVQADQTHHLTGAELCLAGQLEGIDRLLLPRDPFRGFLVEEIASELIKAEGELVKKELVRQGEDRNSLTPSLTGAVQILGKPDKSLILQQNFESKQRIGTYLHERTGEKIILQEQDQDQYLLTPIEDWDEIESLLPAFFQIKTEGTPGSEKGTILAEDYLEAQRIASEKGSDTCQAYLEKKDFDPQQAEMLAQDLSQPRSSGSINLWNWEKREVHQVGGLAFLEGQERMWVIKEKNQQEAVVSIQQSSQKEINELLLKAFQDWID